MQVAEESRASLQKLKKKAEESQAKVENTNSIMKAKLTEFRLGPLNKYGFFDQSAAEVLERAKESSKRMPTSYLCPPRLCSISPFHKSPKPRIDRTRISPKSNLLLNAVEDLTIDCLG
jgi:hypothetical protein